MPTRTGTDFPLRPDPNLMADDAATERCSFSVLEGKVRWLDGFKYLGIGFHWSSSMISSDDMQQQREFERKKFMLLQHGGLEP
jgi:hypothetical protein